MFEDVLNAVIAAFLIALAVMAFTLGILVAVWGLPKVLETIEPFIHAVTA